MSKPLLTEPEADQELEEAASWFEKQREGLGQVFLEAIDATLDRIVLLPKAGAPVPYVPSDLSARRSPVEHFPYHVVYLETPAAIRILAIAHNRRRPGYWLERYRS